jgi:NADH:ubiquinone oxidoreductase subunit 6 (subunit J)
MLNVKQIGFNSYYFVMFSLAGCFLILFLYICLHNSFKYNIDGFVVILIGDSSFSNLEIFGQLLYNYYNIYLILAGIVLLLPLIGASILTYDFNQYKNNTLLTKQLARSINSLIYFK